MAERKIDDAEVQRVVMAYRYANDDAGIRLETRNWSEADFRHANDRRPVFLSAWPHNDELNGWFESLRAERMAEEAQAATEAKAADRHKDIAARLEELKKPHWSVVPNYRMTVVIVILTAAALVVSIIALRR